MVGLPSFTYSVTRQVTPGRIATVIMVQPLEDEPPQHQQRREDPAVKLALRFADQLLNHLCRQPTTKEGQ
jgi:hypothetical protein